VASESITQKAARARQVVARLRRLHPDARLALDFRSPFELLVALILAAQCTDEKVNQVTKTLFVKYRSPRDYARVPRDELEADIRPTGFYRNKARALQGCCQAIIERFGGEVPACLEDLVSLPGVGRKTANILLGNAFHEPAIGVDTHVMRLTQRLGLSRHTDPDRIEADLVRIVRRADWVRFCHLLQFHGRRVCIARRPRCAECQIARVCSYPKSPPVQQEQRAVADRAGPRRRHP
jgi:endonuclease-3